MTGPWGTPKGHGFTDEMESTNFTCWPLPSRKHQVHNRKLLVTCNSASFLGTIPWSTRANALRKSRKSAWTAIHPWCVLSVALSQFCNIQASTDTADWPSVKACWFNFLLSSTKKFVQFLPPTVCSFFLWTIIISIQKSSFLLVTLRGCLSTPVWF